MVDITRYCGAVIETLKQMGEDTAVCDDCKGGLRRYPIHHSHCSCTNVPRSRRFNLNRWEEPFWDGLACRLNSAGIATVTEEGYAKKRCDLALRPTSDVCIMIEGKVLLEKLTYNDTTGYYWESSEQRPDRWKQGLQDVGGKDFLKLTTLASSNATHVGLIVLSFGEPDGPLADPRIMPEHIVANWRSYHSFPEGVTWPDHRPDAAQRGFIDRAWLWYKDVSST
jgi:hypothetical protein